MSGDLILDLYSSKVLKLVSQRVGSIGDSLVLPLPHVSIDLGTKWATYHWAAYKPQGFGEKYVSCPNSTMLDFVFIFTTSMNVPSNVIQTSNTEIYS